MHINTVNFNFGRGGPSAIGAMALLSALAAMPEPTQPAATGGPGQKVSADLNAPPAIGAVWPGQGGIYVGRGRARDGIPEHHLILAMDPRAVFSKRMLGTYGIEVQGADSDHNGMANTIALAAAGSELCKEILALEIEGHTDFYLMSRTDARLCIANVQEQFEPEYYLTSTQYSSFNAWIQYFDYGGQGTSYEKFEARGRAVRRLIL